MRSPDCRYIVSLLASALLFCALNAVAFAEENQVVQDDEDDGAAEYEDEFDEDESETGEGVGAGSFGEVVVSDKRRGHQGITVDEINRERIEDAAKPSVAELLDELPAVQSGFGSRGEMTFRLRGFDQRQLLILIDGVALSIPYDGQTDLYKIPSEAIDKVEIIKGSGSIAYGPNGLGGAINLVTRKPGEGPLFSSSTTFGHNHLISHSLAHSYTVGKLSWFGAVGMSTDRGFTLSSDFERARNEDGGRRNNSDKTDWHAILKTAYKVNDKHELQLGFTFFDAIGGVPPEIYTPTPKYWRWSLWRDIGLQLGHRGRYASNFTMEESVYLSLYKNTVDSFDNDSYTSQETGKSFTSTYNDMSAGFRVRGNAAFYPSGIKRMDLRFWLGGKYDRHEEEWEDETDEKPPLGVFITTLAPELQLEFDRVWTLVFGGQLDVEQPTDYPDEADKHTNWFAGPMLDLRIRPVKEFSIELSAAGRGRFPTLRERFSGAFGSMIPNPDLSSEKSWNFGLDLTAHPVEGLLIRAGAFESEVYDLLIKEIVGTGISQWQNASKARLYGAEADIAWRSSFGLRIEVGYAFLQGVRLDAEPPEDRLEYRPEHSAYTALSYQPLRWFKLGTRFRFVGEQNYTNDITGQWGVLGNYYIWDARMDFYPTGAFHPWIKLSNMLDMEYQPKYGFPQSGREIWFGIRLQYPDGEV